MRTTRAWQNSIMTFYHAAAVSLSLAIILAPGFCRHVDGLNLTNLTGAGFRPGSLAFAGSVSIGQ